jgi:serine phosphatase RsbU (regulator of sigma subunit)
VNRTWPGCWTTWPAGWHSPWTGCTAVGADGQVEQAARPQLLLGVVPDPGYHADVAELRPGEALVCVTDGVTERTDGVRQFDDDNGLARLISGWAGLPAAVIADRIRAAVDDFAGVPPHDDVAVLVLAARPRDAYFR